LVIKHVLLTNECQHHIDTDVDSIKWLEPYKLIWLAITTDRLVTGLVTD
jgi:hypothetical protein